MRHGFIKVASVTPQIKVADVSYNGQEIRKCMKRASEDGAQIVVFPELCITGYTCGDLFWQESLVLAAKEELLKIAKESEKYPGIFFVGLPFAWKGQLYNVAAAVSLGKVLGLVPKIFLPNYNEFYEARYFTSGRGIKQSVSFHQEQEVLLGSHQLFVAKEMPQLRIGIELCEDLWVPNPPSIQHGMAGANLIVNLSASDEVTGKSAYRRDLVVGQSARLVCGYIYTSAGNGESTGDVVYSGHNMIAENGTLLQESAPFGEGYLLSEIDVERLEGQRRRMSTFDFETLDYEQVEFAVEAKEVQLTRFIDPAPFVPGNQKDRQLRCEEILNIQASGLKKRLEHIQCQTTVIGISGGLDSTLALLVTARAYDMLQWDHKRMIAITMPGFGTTDRTYENALQLIHNLGATLLEIDIKEAVNQHFADIGHDASVHDVTYENCQARERTQILMDVANKENGIVIGTGDLSELALGWATYNGDHMSMYAVNCSVPKTLVRHLVRYCADTTDNDILQKTLLDVLDTPVSPELLPPTEDGKISQKTEDFVGPYELHDFFLYYMFRFGFAPSKILRLAEIAFAGVYEKEFILKWLKTFYRRYFMQQFKRSCLPDGPKVGTVAVSPRGDLRMPSDASAALWLSEVDKL